MVEMPVLINKIGCYRADIEQYTRYTESNSGNIIGGIKMNICYTFLDIIIKSPSSLIPCIDIDHEDSIMIKVSGCEDIQDGWYHGQASLVIESAVIDEPIIIATLKEQLTKAESEYLEYCEKERVQGGRIGLLSG